MIKKLLTVPVLAFAAVLLIPSLAAAHVVVTPKTATKGERTTFTVSVPNEKDVEVTSLKLDVPAGPTSVSPTILAGWDINTTTEGENVTSITWSGGAIPKGQRADFSFRALMPANATELQWKAYQTYSDGVTVSWDQAPTKESHGSEEETKGPYSVTQVTDKADETETDSHEDGAKTEKKDSASEIISLVFSLAALVAASIALLRKR